MSSEGRPKFGQAYYNWANKGKIIDVFFCSYEVAGILAGSLRAIDLFTTLWLVVTPFIILIFGAIYYKRIVYGNQLWIESVQVRFRESDLKKNVILRRSENTVLSINIVLGESISSWSFKLKWEGECLVRDPFYRSGWKIVTGKREHVFCCWSDTPNRNIPLKFNITAIPRKHYTSEVMLSLSYLTNIPIDRVRPTVAMCKKLEYKKLHDFVAIIIPEEVPQTIPQTEEIF